MVLNIIEVFIALQNQVLQGREAAQAARKFHCAALPDARVEMTQGREGA